jgi:hypothetical protein
MLASTLVGLLTLLGVAEAVALPPAPTPPPALAQRDVASTIGSLTSALAPEVSSYLASLPSDAVQGVLPAFEKLPTPDDIKSKLNVSDDELQQEPLKVLNIPWVELQAGSRIMSRRLT